MLFQLKSLAIQGHRKLAPRFVGPFHIIHKIETQYYELELPVSRHVYTIFHVSLLKTLPPSLVVQ